MSGRYVPVGGLYAYRSDEWIAARERREQMAAIRVTHAYVPQPASLMSKSPWVVARCSCSWAALDSLPPDKAAARWREHVARVAP